MKYIKCKECGKEVSVQATVCSNCGNPVTQFDILEQKRNKMAKDYIIKLKREKLIIGIISIVASILMFFSTLSANMVRFEIGEESNFFGFLISISMFVIGIITIRIRKKTNKSSYIVPACLYLLTGLFTRVYMGVDSNYGSLYMLPLFLGVCLLINMFILRKYEKD